MIKIYKCDICEKNFSVTIHEDKNNSSSLPIPGMKKRLFHNHHSHGLFFELYEREVTNMQSVPIVRSVIESIVFNNILIANVANNLLKIENFDNKPSIIFVTDIDSFKVYFESMMEEYLNSEDEVVFHYTGKSLIVDHEELRFVITSIDEIEKFLIKDYKITSSIFGEQKIHAKSLILDVQGNIDNIKSKLTSKKIHINRDMKVIIAFNDKKNNIPPFDIQSIFEKKHKLTEIDILNYFDTNGLNSIILQAFYNLSKDPIKVRDTFEIYYEQVIGI